MTEEEIRRVVYLSRFHDIGKQSLPRSILHKPGKLTLEERRILQQQPALGVRLLRSNEALREYPYYDIVYDICLHHHEQWDGGGYPDGLKGASVGGPFDAVAGALWEARGHIGKIIAAILVLVMLPVLYILMLPSLIFGGLTDSGSSTSTQPILNDNTAAIVQNVNDIAFAINQVLGEGIDNAETRIAQDFAGTGGYSYEIVNSHEANMVSNTNSFLEQYCAAKGEDWANIFLSDLEQTLRQGKDQIYIFSRTSEQRMVDNDDPDTTDVVEQKEVTVYIYTLSYNGESYLADSIFHLKKERYVDRIAPRISGAYSSRYPAGSPGRNPDKQYPH